MIGSFHFRAWLAVAVLSAGLVIADEPAADSDDPVAIGTEFEQMLPTSVLPIPGAQPTLPLSGGSPFPPEANPNSANYLDARTPKQRYLGDRPSNVKPDGTIIGGDGVKSFFDHPGVQPRAQRSQHYRVCVPNVNEVPVPKPWRGRRGSAGDDDGADPRPPGDPLEIPPGPIELPGAIQPAYAPGVGAIPYESLPKILPRHDVWVTYIQTAPGMFPNVDPFLRPPGTNMLPTVYQNMRDRNDREMPNTLPSHPNNPYNLHAKDPVVTRLPTHKSPTDDLRFILDNMFELVTGTAPRKLWERLDEVTLDELLKSTLDHTKKIEQHRALLLLYSQWAIDMIEGNDGDDSKVPSNRAYRGFALLHHSGHKRNTRVMPIFNDKGEVVSGNADVHQIWYDGRIESSTMFYDFGWDDEPNEQGEWYGYYDGKKKRIKRPVPIPPDVPWTVTYTIDVLNRGEDDFSPTQVYFDDLEGIEDTPGEIPTGRVFDPTRGKNILVRFGPPHVAMDQTFFPMAEGTRTVFKIKMAPPKYSNVTYTWGWRKHPPRAQAVENSHKRIPPSGKELSEHYKVLKVHPDCPTPPNLSRLRIVDHERLTFEGIRSIEDEVERNLEYGMSADPRQQGETPQQHEQRIRRKLHDRFEELRERVPFLKPVEDPISRIGDLAPAKRMWRVFRKIREQLESGPVADYRQCLLQILDARDAYLDWNDRNHLPSGLLPDPQSDFTLLYVNNTMYGESHHGGLRFDEWRTRVADPEDPKRQDGDLRLTIINADYFLHGYINPDFGGSRGWENQFKPTLALGGAGSFFTFGRFHWRFNSEPGAIGIPPAVLVDEDGKDLVEPNTEPTLLSKDGVPRYDVEDAPYAVRPFIHRVWIRYNFEPSRRLRFYQFDPLHHDVNIFSIH